MVPSQNSTSTLPKQHKNNGTHQGRDKSSGRTSNGFDKKYPTMDRKYRAQDEFDTTYRSGYDIENRYRDPPVGSYNHSKVMI